MVTPHKHFLLREEMVEVGSCTFQQCYLAKHKNKGAKWKKKKNKRNKRKETHQSLEHLLFARIWGIFSLGTFSSFSIKNLFLVINSAALAELRDKFN